ncbi:Crp/Fnr family transcriptional regulator [Pseudoflavonifractor sp. AF19-9AC]|uniref:Crp/Fnr family transcriptional regulator n=1 Tax=Pseudoflavonifractor sp. AF19-9AC TaxID=2292244 RepID=UPI000E5188A4|nr:Crp/Fnr family transcriptional regulator [Pseudoflavonifractor sp. AF19-9AC]RHR11182.1 Crp/Fnr family transcriptional regulator [Pseudoflavonifractor sp. AF19-9AC]
MSVSDYIPFWNKLTPSQQDRLTAAAIKRQVRADTVVHNGSADCLGLLLLESGQLRVFILSPEGREITLYRLFERDMCLFSSSCMMSSIQFDVTIQAEKDTSFWVIPPDVYKALMEESAPVANYTNELISSRFSDVMWLMEQILWKSFDRRLAGFLLEESVLEQSDLLHLTHEKIANHLGTAREVVTRMLRYFQSEGMVTLSRGTVELTDKKRLMQLSNP